MQCEALKLLYDVRAAFDALIELQVGKTERFWLPHTPMPAEPSP